MNNTHTHTHTHIYIYIYIYICVCVCVCVCVFCAFVGLDDELHKMDGTYIKTRERIEFEAELF